MRIQHFFTLLDVRLSDKEFVCGLQFTVADITGMVTVDFCSLGKAQAAGSFNASKSLAFCGFSASQR